MPAAACVIEFGTVHVTPTFQIIMRHAQQPIGGITVAIYRAKRVQGETEKEPFLRLVADKNGVIKVGDLNAGTYFVATEGPGQGAAIYAVVGSGEEGKARSEFAIEWPAQSNIIKTNRLAGQLLNSNEWAPLEKTLGHAQIELWVAGATAPAATQTTSEDGRFQFKESLPGIYILRVKGDHEGEIALDLVPAKSEPFEFLTLHLEETSCGLSYRRCPAAPSINLASPHINFVGPKGIPLSKTAYQVEDLQGQVLVSGETNDAGQIALPNDLQGNIRFRLAEPANSVDQPMHVSLGAANGTSSQIVFAVQFDGVCSRLSLETYATPK